MNREGRARGRSQAGPRPLGGPADVLVGRGAHLCVAVHDVAPATWADCERVLQAVAEVADGPVSLLAVPRYHGAPHSRGFGPWLRWRAREGDELGLHGYTPLAAAPPRGRAAHGSR